MTQTGQSRLARLRALCAALFLLLAAVSSSVALATQTSDVCSMACCVKEGHCCCSPSHAYVEGQPPDSKPQISDYELWASCPEGCAATGRFSNLLLRDNPRPATPQAFDEKALASFIEQVAAARDRIEYGSSTPRAPPISSIL